ncbi:hypothetical protein Ct61P_03883 [Colletotrichum tofieldiae]|nr:hypothetical protein Ct61P_03883 [Colletotrichum tofieldiae]
MTLLAAALLPQAKANFDVYRVEAISPRGGVSVYWQAFEAEGSCAKTGTFSQIWISRDDVSGSKKGVRCKGSGCAAQAPIRDIEQLEMHFSNNPLYHWTIYNNRDNGQFLMYGLNGRTYGNCIPFPNGDYNCVDFLGVRWQGRRKFRCLTQYTANDLYKDNPPIGS